MRAKLRGVYVMWRITRNEAEKEKWDSLQSRLWGMDTAHGQKSFKIISHLQLCFAAQRAFTHRTVIGPPWIGTMTNSIAQMRKLRLGRD